MPRAVAEDAWTRCACLRVDMTGIGGTTYACDAAKMAHRPARGTAIGARAGRPAAVAPSGAGPGELWGADLPAEANFHMVCTPSGLVGRGGLGEGYSSGDVRVQLPS